MRCAGRYTPMRTGLHRPLDAGAASWSADAAMSSLDSRSFPPDQGRETMPLSHEGGERGSEARSPLSPGRVVAGKYRLERVLGAGGMGVVHEATHLALGERVALK